MSYYRGIKVTPENVAKEKILQKQVFTEELNTMRKYLKTTRPLAN